MDNKNTYPWAIDTAGTPYLDTKEKLLAYASAILHRPAEIHLIHYTPRDIPTVNLYYGQSPEQQATAMNKLKKDFKNRANRNKYSSDPADLLDLIAIPSMFKNGKPEIIPLGIVNGSAADTLNNLANTQATL